jgi:hypothetical protein
MVWYFLSVPNYRVVDEIFLYLTAGILATGDLDFFQFSIQTSNHSDNKIIENLYPIWREPAESWD